MLLLKKKKKELKATPNAAIALAEKTRLAETQPPPR